MSIISMRRQRQRVHVTKLEIYPILHQNHYFIRLLFHHGPRLLDINIFIREKKERLIGRLKLIVMNTKKIKIV